MKTTQVKEKVQGANLQKVIKEFLPLAAAQKGRNLYMPGDGRYQPEPLKPFLGYDMWSFFLIIVEWFWLKTQASIGFMPAKDAALLTDELLFTLLMHITTTRQDKVEKRTHHDILALLELMRRYLPKALHKYLHLGATSYDIVNTAYALIINLVYKLVFWPRLQRVDLIWREKISEYADVVQAGRTHLQTALPVTVGLWLAYLHYRFNDCANNAYELALKVPGKFTGPVGTSAALIAMLGSKQTRQAQATLMKYLDLSAAKYTTQITPPEDTARFYFELVLLSGAQGNLGEDIRILQSSQFGEIVGAAATDSSSSTMPHKRANPVVAENDCGMHVEVMAEFMKVMLTLISDLQRDLRWSCVMRSYCACMTYGYQQLMNTEKLLNSLAIDRDRIRNNFTRQGNLVVAELLHLCLQRQGYAGTHELVNKVIVPKAAQFEQNLAEVMDNHFVGNPDKKLWRAWRQTPANLKELLKHPEQYIGDAVRLARAESLNVLK